MPKKKKIYLNDKQQAFLAQPQNISLFLAGRRTGKTRSLGHARYRSAASFPGATGGLAGQTYGSLLTVTLPEITDVWENDYKLKENVHYVIGAKPPKHFRKAIKEPRKYQNVISFFNGHRVTMLSSDRPDLHRGGTLIDLDVDEGLKVKADAFYKVFLPMVSGYTYAKGRVNGTVEYFKTMHGFHQKRIYSTVPWLETGYWLMDLIKKAEEMPSVFGVVEACTMDNVAILGLDYIELMRKTLPHVVFQAEVMNNFIRRVSDGYYHNFRTERHCISDTYTYGEGKRGIAVERDDADRNSNALLDFTCDFGGRINCGLACQYYDNEVHVLREFYVKDDEGKLRELVNRFCDQYSAHQLKYVRLWGDPMGQKKNPDTMPHFLEMQRFFNERSWSAEICADTSYPESIARHNMISEMFLEKTQGMPKIRINENFCPSLILVLQTTKIKDDFTKDKSMERKEDFPQEQAPHLSDAFDYLLTQLFAEWLNSDGTFWLPEDRGWAIY